MKTYNHLYTIAFSMSGSTDREGADLTSQQFAAAIRARVAELLKNGDEMLEAVGVPLETYEEGDEIFDILPALKDRDSC